MNQNLQENFFGMFIVLKLHRESLRQMIQQGRVSHSIKIRVLGMIKETFDECNHHGDVKEFLVLYYAITDLDLKNQKNSRKTF